MVATSTTDEPGLTVLDPPRPVFRRKRFLLPFGVSAGLALVGVVALFAGGTVALPFQAVTVVRALMASKADFFNDGEVRRILMSKGIQVHLTDSGGSLEISRDKADSFDFVMPSGQVTARRIHDELGGTLFYPFTTPLVVAAFREYADALGFGGVATPRSEGSLYYRLDMAAFVELTRSHTTWAALGTGLTNANQVIAQSPDPCRAYSGAAYVGLVAFALNGKRTPTAADAAEVAARVRPLFEVEGQFGAGIGRTFFAPDGRTFALLYPDAHHHTEPWLIAFSEGLDLGVEGVRTSEREVVKTYIENSEPIAVIGVLLGALESASGVVHVDLRDRTLLRNTALEQHLGASGAVRLRRVDSYVSVKGVFRVHSRGDGTTVFLAPFSDPDDPEAGPQVRVECLDSGLRDDVVPDGGFHARCLGKVQAWKADAGQLVIRPIAMFQ